VEAQRDDPASLLSLYRRLLRVRRSFVEAPYETVSVDGALVFRRGEFVVAVNVSGEEVAVSLRGRVAVASEVAREGSRVDGEVRLPAGSGLVVRAG
jgi:alpha-glucosidase